MSLLENIERGLESLREKDVEAAAAISAELGAVPPNGASDKERAKFFEFVGDLALAEGRPGDAHDAYTFMIKYEEKAGESRGGIGNSWGKIGEALASMGKYSEAAPCFERGLKMMREDGFATEFQATLNFQLAEALQGNENYTGSAREYRNTLELIGADGDDRSIAFVNFRLGNAFGMLALLEHTIREVQQMQAQLKAMGIDDSVLQDVLGSFTTPEVPYVEQARSAYEITISRSEIVDPALSINGHIDLGRILHQTGHLDDAADTLTQGLAKAEEHPDRVSIHQRIQLFHELATAHLELGELEQAEPFFGAATELRRAHDVPSGWSDFGLARIASLKRDHAKAIRLGREALANVDPSQRTDALLALAEILDSAGEEVQATEARAEAQSLLAEH